MQVTSKYAVQQLAACLQQQSVHNIVISPGSRNAPLTIQFTSDDFFDCYSVVDERSAGFFGLGMAQKTEIPSVLCCTSGSAVVNYYPAIVEAFYQNIPLIVISADRPNRLLDKFDGQTIRQYKVFDSHVFASIDIDGDSDEIPESELVEIQKLIQNCILKKLPIHINISFEEPLYDFTDSTEIKLTKLPFVEIAEASEKEVEEFCEAWEKSKRRLVLVGCQSLNPELDRLLEKRAEAGECIVFCETTSNLKSTTFFHHTDRLIFKLNEEQFALLKPDFILTIGQNLISKKVKDFLRKAKPKFHFHLDYYWQPDTFFCLTNELPYLANNFLKKIENKSFPQNKEYIAVWNNMKESKDQQHDDFVKDIPFSDLKVFGIIQKKLHKNINLHFGNSASIRYGQMFDFHEFAETNCNRGVSGIDGCTGTAIGSAVMDITKPTVLITGDLSFFYDANSLWNHYIPNNFCIIVINNGGGNIFKIIPGPDKTNALDRFFATQHQRDVSHFAEMYGFEYQNIDNELQLEICLQGISELSKKPKLIEVKTMDVANHEILKSYFKTLQ